MTQIHKQTREYNDLKRKVEVLDHQFKNQQENFNNDGKDKIQQNLKNISEDIEDLYKFVSSEKKEIETNEAELLKVTERIEELEEKEETQRDVLEDMLEKSKKEVEAVSDKFKHYQSQVHKLEYESEELEKDLKRSKHQIGVEKNE